MTRRRRGAWPRVVVVGCAIAVTAVALGPPAAPAPAPSRQDPGLVRLFAQSPAVEPGGTFRLQLQVTGAPPGAELIITVRNRVLNRIQYLETIAGQGFRSRLDTFSVALDEVVPDPSGTLVLDMPTAVGAGGPFAVAIRSAGVYPVVVELEDSDGATLSQFTTHLVRLPAPDTGDPPMRVALVVPFQAPPGQQPDGSVALDGLARVGMVTTASSLQRYASVPMTVTPRPETLDALGLDPASPNAGLLESIRRAATGRQILAGPYVDVDLGAWLHSDNPAVLTQQLDLGVLTVSRRLGDVDPTTAIAGATLDAATAGRLRDRGVTNLVMPESVLEPLDAEIFPATLTQPFALADVEGVRAAAADEILAGHVGTSGDPVLDAHHVLADLAVLYFDDPPIPRGVVTALPGDRPFDPALLEALIGGLQAMPVLVPTTLETYFAEVPMAGADGPDTTTPPLVRRLRPAAPPGLGSLPRRLGEAQSDVISFAATAEPAGPPNPDDLSRLLLVAPDRSLSQANQTAYIRGVRTTMNTELAQVDLPRQQTFTLTARQGVVSVVVRNTADYPMTVLLQMSGERLEFPQNPDGQVRLELTEETTRVELTVRTLTSGDAPMTLAVATADGRQELDRSRFTIRSTAVSGMGLALIGGSLLFLAGWWGRNVHRSRRNRRLVPARPAE